MTVEFRQIEIADTDAFRAAVDSVARERRYIALTEAPPVEQVRAFVTRNVERGCPQIVAVVDGAVIGWCNVPPASRAVSAHVGDLFMGLLPDFRGKGYGERLLRQAVQAADVFGFRRIDGGSRAGGEKQSPGHDRTGHAYAGSPSGTDQSGDDK